MDKDKSFRRFKSKYKSVGLSRFRIKRIHIICLVLFFLVMVFILDYKYHNKQSNSAVTHNENPDSDGGTRVDNSGGGKNEAVFDFCNSDSYDSTVNDIIKDFGKHECQHPNELKIKVKGNNKLHISGYNINYLSSKEIVKKGESFVYGENHILLGAQFKDPEIKKGSSGALKNEASKLCINPEKDAKNKEEIPLVYSSECFGDVATFTYTPEGTVYHNATGMCFSLKEQDTKLKDNAVLVLTKKNCLKFEVVHGGVLKTSTFCLHPLWGGQPKEGQQLCYYPDCADQSRLKFKMFETKKKEAGLLQKEVEFKKELNYLQVGMADTSVFQGFAMSTQRKQLKDVHPSSPNKPNIYIIAFDEVSSNHFKRKLPKSSKYLLESMKATDYKLHASITNSAPETIFHILTGHDDTDESSASKTLFKTSLDEHYVTLFSSDNPFVELNKLVEPHHNAIPLFQSMKKNLDPVASQYCTLSQPLYDLSFNYLSTFMDTYRSEAKFGMIFLGELMYRNYNIIGYMDDSLYSFLEKVMLSPNTILFLTSVRGSLVGKLGKHPQGQKEYKRPLLNVYVSKDLRDSYVLPKERLTQITSPFDLYSTIGELLTKKASNDRYGLSLFKKSTVKRDCHSAGVMKTMCPCKLK